MKPLIVVTNDDGVLSQGIAVLAEVAAQFGEVLVCAPDTERSGSSHAITFHTHLRANPIREGWWHVSGTPVDCTYLALHHLCDRKPALVLSGINAGYNLGTDVFYSGTVGGASEAYLRGISAIATSVDRGASPWWIVPALRRLVPRVLAEPGVHLLNVNAPALPGHEGAPDEDARRHAERLPVEVTRLGAREYEDMVEHRTDPQGRPYFWIGGPARPTSRAAGEDTWAVAEGRVSVTPLELDITATDLGIARRLVGDDSQSTEER